MLMGRVVDVADTKIHVEERGPLSAFPVLVFHGGPGLDHTWFADYLDPLTDDGGYRLVLGHDDEQHTLGEVEAPLLEVVEQVSADRLVLGRAVSHRHGQLVAVGVDAQGADHGFVGQVEAVM
jgi:proline iminopeptidase